MAAFVYSGTCSSSITTEITSASSSSIVSFYSDRYYFEIKSVAVVKVSSNLKSKIKINRCYWRMFDDYDLRDYYLHYDRQFKNQIDFQIIGHSRRDRKINKRKNRLALIKRKYVRQDN